MAFGVVIVTRVVKLLPTPEQASALMTTLHAQARAGRLGKQSGTRRIKALSRPIEFGPYSAQPFDDRMPSWRHDARSVSIWTVSGRLKDVAFTGEPGQLKEIAEFRRGESDLVHRDGMWFPHVAVELPEAALNVEPSGWLGVDPGIVNIREQDLRAKLQAKGTKSAKRLLKKRRRKESRHATDVNHCISKRIVAEAQRAGRGIALEDLRGIRELARFRRPQRATLHSWSFDQLGGFAAYKARCAGVPVVHVNPAYTSQECAECHYVDKRDRPSQAVFECRSCGVVAHADHNSSRVIAQRGEDTWTAGRESRVPAPRKECSDVGGNTAASRALSASSVL